MAYHPPPLGVRIHLTPIFSSGPPKDSRRDLLDTGNTLRRQTDKAYGLLGVGLNAKSLHPLPNLFNFKRRAVDFLKDLYKALLETDSPFGLRMPALRHFGQHCQLTTIGVL